MSKLRIEGVLTYRVETAEGGVYLRAYPTLPNGPTAIWYAATVGGWELIPDSLKDALEADFQQQRKEH